MAESKGGIPSIFPLNPILRFRAEASGLIVPDIGLLLHVLLSAGSRARAAQVLSDSKDAIANVVESQYRDIMQGRLRFRNDAARGLFPPDGKQAALLKAEGAMLGTTQHRAVLSAALLGQPGSGIVMRDSTAGSARKRRRVLQSHNGTPGVIVLIAGAQRYRRRSFCTRSRT